VGMLDAARASLSPSAASSATANGWMFDADPERSEQWDTRLEDAPTPQAILANHHGVRYRQ
jgi:hypothetical protein